MKSMNSFLEIVLLHSYMYFVGPCIWGIWMVYKLGIVTHQEFGHSMLSPVATILLASYFLFNLLYMRNALKRLATAPSLFKDNPKQTYYFDAMKLRDI